MFIVTFLICQTIKGTSRTSIYCHYDYCFVKTVNVKKKNKNKLFLVLVKYCKEKDDDGYLKEKSKRGSEIARDDVLYK